MTGKVAQHIYEDEVSMSGAIDAIEALCLAVAKVVTEQCAETCERHKKLMDKVEDREAGHVAAFLEHTIRARVAHLLNEL